MLNKKFEKYVKGFKKGYGSEDLVMGDYLDGGWLTYIKKPIKLFPKRQGILDGRKYVKPTLPKQDRQEPVKEIIPTIRETITEKIQEIDEPKDKDNLYCAMCNRPIYYRERFLPMRKDDGSYDFNGIRKTYWKTCKECIAKGPFASNSRFVKGATLK